MHPLRRLLAYSSVSLVLLPLNLAIAWALTRVGVNYLLATAAGFGVHVTLEFFINRYWTFNHSDIKAMSGFARALCVRLSALGVVLLTTKIGVETMGLDFAYARGVAVVVSAAWCYILDHIFTFRVRFLY